MGPLRIFLKAVERLARNGDITIQDAYRFAKQEFGEVSDLMKLQINRLFKQKQAPSIKKQKEGEVVPFTKKQDTPDQASGLESLKNPYRPKGGLDPVEGMTRTAARVVLDRYGIKVAERVDPIDAFEENFGGDALMDLKNVGEELLEKEQMGRITESMGEFLEKRGMFDLKVDKTAPKGMTDEELLKKMEEVEQEEVLKKFDPKDREPNSKGGINRASFARGKIKLVQYLAGKGLNLAKEIKKSVEDIFTTDDIKYDADVAVDNMLDDLGIDRDTVDQKDLLDAYGMAYDELKKPLLANIKNKPAPMAPKMEERFALKEKYPGIDDELLTRIIDDSDPQRKAEVLATLDQAMEMMKQGKGSDEIVDILGQSMDRKKQAGGGLSYLMGM